MKQAICLNTQFFYSRSLHPPATVDELFQRGNRYAMLEDDIVIATKRTVTITSDAKQYSGSKGMRGRDDQDKRGECDSRDTRQTGHHNEAQGSGDRVTKNPRKDDSTEQTRFTLQPSQLLPIIQLLQGFEWLRP